MTLTVVLSLTSDSIDGSNTDTQIDSIYMFDYKSLEAATVLTKQQFA